MSPVADPTIECWRWSCKTWGNHDEDEEDVKLQRATLREKDKGK